MTAANDRPRTGRMPRNERRAQLLSAARDVFVAQGYHAAAMDAIAEHAGVSKPVLYQHFPGKLDLYLALLDTACGEVVEEVRTALASTTVNRDRVAATIKAFFSYIADPSGAFRLVFESDLTGEKAVRERVERVTDQCADAITEVIAEDTGFEREAARLIAVALVGMSQVSARYWVDSDPHMSQDDAVALVSSLGWRGVRGFPRHDD